MEHLQGSRVHYAPLTVSLSRVWHVRLLVVLRRRVNLRASYANGEDVKNEGPWRGCSFRV